MINIVILINLLFVLDAFSFILLFLIYRLIQLKKSGKVYINILKMLVKMEWSDSCKKAHKKNK